jgi:NTE family protein
MPVSRAGPGASRLLGLICLWLLSTGCAGFRAANSPLEAFDAGLGYGKEDARRRQGDVLLALAFSGGGTRAAALSYGVLEELRDTDVVVGGERKRLLDEVDVISSVSGGSFTSTYYGLYGDRIFEDPEEREYFNNLPTSFSLPDDTIDRLRDAARRLLRESEDYQQLLDLLR